MIKTSIAIIAVILLIALGVFAGVIPTGSLLEYGLDTVHEEISGCIGNPGSELLDSKAYICSYKTDGFSEKIVVRGTISHGSWSLAHVDKYRYNIYLRENTFSTYELLSSSSGTSMYFNAMNPGEMPSNWPGGEGAGQLYTAPSYTFSIVGDHYDDGAIKAEFQVYMDWNQLNPFDDGYQWRTISIDEAMLYSGHAGLYLPRGVEDGVSRPYDTFEVGQEVDIRVETSRGGYGTDKPWRVTLNEPFSGSVDDPDDGGGVVHEQYFANDVTNGHFRFTVTEEMAQRSMQSSDPYTIRIWNILLPKGSLFVDFLDFIALAPSDVEYSISDLQVKVGETCRIGLTASSENGIDYFRVSVIYGTNDVLLPSDPLSSLWLIQTTNVGGADSRSCSIPQYIEFIPEYASYITVHAKAFDIDGRGSVRTRTYTLWAYADTPAPDETVQDETGGSDYGGGQTSGYTPWDPEQGDWETSSGELVINWLGVFIAVLIILGMMVLGFLYFGGQIKMTIMMGVVGTIIAVCVYVVFFTNLIN